MAAGRVRSLRLKLSTAALRALEQSTGELRLFNVTQAGSTGRATVALSAPARMFQEVVEVGPRIESS